MFLINKKTITGILVTSCILFAFHNYVSAQSNDNQDEASKGNSPQAQFTAEGVAGCLRCHAGDHSSIVAETAHGNEENPYTPYANHGCESCHGPGSFHSSRARGGVGFPALLTFRRGEEPRQEQNQACTSCHGKDMGELQGMQWEGSLHEQKGMTCNFCHQLHAVENQMRDLQLQREQCSKCHKRKIAAHADFASEGIVFEKLLCSTCHNVHQL